MTSDRQMDQEEFSPSDVPSWQDALADDTREVPETFFFSNKVDYGCEPIPIDRYTSREFHELEVEKLWKKVWQFACFEEDIPEVGDYITYDIAGISIIITRSAEGEFSAFYNTCLHRAAQLAQDAGHAESFVCPFHAWEFELDGTVKHVPQGWDFPTVCAGKDRIKPVRIESFRSILYINMDTEAEPLKDYLGRLPEFLKPFPIEGRRQRIAWVRKIIPGNWKTAVEAFQEGYHLPTSHYQLKNTLPGPESETDIISDNISRLTGASTLPNCQTGPDLTEQEILDLAIEGLAGRHTPKIDVPEGQKARAVQAEAVRAMMKERNGLDTSEVSDAEILDSALFHVFPNSVVWGSWSMPVMYRWRPNGDDHTTALFEIFMFMVYPEGAEIPPPAQLYECGIDEPFASAPPLGDFGPVIDQDVENLGLQAKGLRTTQEEGLYFARFQESLVRHFHKRLDDLLG